MRYYHMQNYSKICDVCAKTFNCEKTFQSHCLTHTNQPRMQCTICDKWLKSKDSLRSHLRRHNDTQHTCKHCNKMTPNRQALANHILYVHSEKKHKCTLCSKAFKVALGLKVQLPSPINRIEESELIVGMFYFRNTWLRIPVKVSTPVHIALEHSTPMGICISTGRMYIPRNGAAIERSDCENWLYQMKMDEFLNNWQK